MNTFTILLSILNIIAIINCQIVCRDENGHPVDWYVVYKLPIVDKAASPLNTGLRYTYMTSVNASGWILSDRNIDDEKSLFHQTLGIFYNNSVVPYYVFYSDQPPVIVPTVTNVDVTAHAKGVLAVHNTSGFWFMHTVPNFPPKVKPTYKYQYPSTGVILGQTALCISFNHTEIEEINYELQYIKPYIYDTHNDFDLYESSNVSGQVSRAVHWQQSAIRTKNINSAGGVRFTAFFKGPADHVDLYTEMVVPLNTSLYVESWRKGSSKRLIPYCTPNHTVENVLNVNVNVSTKLLGHFTNGNDHSKWAISKTNNTPPYVCFGDMNRQESQLSRGGSATCFHNDKVWESMIRWVDETTVEGCTPPTTHPPPIGSLITRKLRYRHN